MPMDGRIAWVMIAPPLYAWMPYGSAWKRDHKADEELLAGNASSSTLAGKEEVSM
jgi:hypothetical protein